MASEPEIGSGADQDVQDTDLPANLIITDAAQAAQTARPTESAEQRSPGAVSPEAWEEDEEFAGVLTEEAPEVPRGPRSIYTRRKIKKQAEDTAAYLIMILEGAAIIGFGEDARMLSGEKKRITEPLGRIMSRAQPEVMEAIEKYTDPVLLIFSLVAYGSRLYAIATESDEGDQGSRRGPDDEEPPQPQSPNGRNRQPAADEDASMFAGPDARILSQVNPTGVIE